MNALAYHTSTDHRPATSSVAGVIASAPDHVVTWVRGVVTQPEVFEAYNEFISTLADSGPLQAAINLTVNVAAQGIKRARSHPCCPGEFTFHCKAA
jgi:hypothetical protein